MKEGTVCGGGREERKRKRERDTCDEGRDAGSLSSRVIEPEDAVKPGKERGRTTDHYTEEKQA